MLYLITQIWLHLLLAFALGAASTWWWLTREAHVRSEASKKEPLPRPETSRVESLRLQLDAARSDARAAREALAARARELEELRASAVVAREPRGPGKPDAEGSSTPPRSKEGVRETAGPESGSLSTTSPATGAHPDTRSPPARRSKPLTPRLPDALVEHAGPPDDDRDDLTRIRGVGPVLARLLNEMGIYTFREIAHWSPEDVDRVQARLSRFPGRIRRDDWVRQAAELDRTS